MLSRLAPAEPTTSTDAAPAGQESARPGEPAASGQEVWLDEIAREPEWSLDTPASATIVEEEATTPTSTESSSAASGAEPGSAPEPEMAPPQFAADPRAREFDEALDWEGQDTVDTGETTVETERAEIDEAAWPYLDFPVDELGFPIVLEGYEQLFFGPHGAQRSTAAAGESHAASGGPGEAGAPRSPERDPERIARVLQTLAEQVRAGALRLPGEVDRRDEAVILAATLTALLSRNRE